MPTSLRRCFLSAVAAFCFLGLTTLAYAQQWATTGNDIYNTNTGNVGIGTTTPGSRLEVGDVNPVFRLSDTSSSSNARNWAIGNGFGGASYGMLGFYISSVQGSAPATTPSVVMDKSGNVGIGTTGPASLLHVLKANGDNVVNEATNNGAAAAFRLVGKTLGGTAQAWNQAMNAYTGNGEWALLDGTAQRLPIIVEKNATDYTLYLKSGGNVGIGTTSPGAALDVTKNTNNSLLRLNNVSWANWDFVIPNDLSYGIRQGSLLIKPGVGNTDFAIGTQGGGIGFTATNTGNVGIGTTTPSSRLHVVGDVTITGSISAKYQDIAEWVPSTMPLMAGTVVILDSNHTNYVITSSEPYDTRVAGVVSSSPGLVLGEADVNKVKVATTGRVRVRVDATPTPIRAGDLLVTSNKEGVAMRSEPVEVAGIRMHRPGTLIGKALESLESGEGEIFVLLSLQ